MSHTLAVEEAVVGTTHYARTNNSTGSLAIRAQVQPAESSATTRSVRSGKHGIGNTEAIELATIGQPRADTIDSGSEKGVPTQPPEPPADDASSNDAKKWGARLQFATVCWSIFTIGWNDGATGPLLPRMQEQYHVGQFQALFWKV